MSRNSALTLKLLSPEGIFLVEENLTALSIPLANGTPIGIHPGHAPLIAETGEGTLIYRSRSFEKKIVLHAGVLDVRDNTVVILTAGERETLPESMAEGTPSAYDRMMQTLIQQIQPSREGADRQDEA